jgi:hypothetical protein
VESEEQQILKALEAHTPWNEIAKRFKVSSKTIAKIAKSRKSQADANSAVQVFNLLSGGMTPEKIVIKLGIHPNLVGELLEQFEILKAYNPSRRDESYKDGYRAGCQDCTIIHPCKICGKNMTFDLSQGRDRKQIMDILEQGGISNWLHTKCEPESSDKS